MTFTEVCNSIPESYIEKMQICAEDLQSLNL